MNLFFFKSSVGPVRFFRATGSSFFSQTHNYTEVSDRKDGEVSLAAAPGPEYGNGSLKCFDPVSLCSQKKIPQHIPSLISSLHVFHHFFFCTFPPFYVQPYLTNDPKVCVFFSPSRPRNTWHFPSLDLRFERGKKHSFKHKQNKVSSPRIKTHEAEVVSAEGTPTKRSHSVWWQHYAERNND